MILFSYAYFESGDINSKLMARNLKPKLVINTISIIKDDKQILQYNTKDISYEFGRL